MPATICAAIRVGSNVTDPSKVKSAQAYADTSVKSAEPTPTSMCVRRPAARSRISRSSPIAPHRAAAARSRNAISRYVSSGTVDRVALRRGDLLDSLRASSTISPSRSCVNGSRSAVAWMSIRRPPPVMTTFMSTSAEESSR